MTTTATWASSPVRIAANSGDREVLGFVSEQVRGLALTPFQPISGAKSERWVLTHIPSGTSIGEFSFGTLDVARAAAERIASLADWTQSADALRGMPATKRRAVITSVNRVMQDV